MSRRRVKGWPGYVHRQANGLDLFIIEKQINGQRYHVSTCANTITAALKQLEQFQAAPAEYNPGASLYGEGGLAFDGQLVIDYFNYLVGSTKKGGKGNGRKHSRQMLNRMTEWCTDLRGKDLKKLDLGRDIIPVLNRRTNRKNRIIALKGFFRWLRTVEHLLKSQHDPTLDLPVPVSEPEQNLYTKVVPFEHVLAVAPLLSTRARDMLNLLVATGWHISEAERFIREPLGEVMLDPPKPPNQVGPPALAALIMKHKSGDQTSTPITSQDHLESAIRLKASGEFPNQSRLNQQLREACAAARIDGKPVPKFTLGVMRHSVATWAVEEGATVKEVAVFLHHKSPSTTRKFYVRTKMPVPAVPVRSLLRVVR